MDTETTQKITTKLFIGCHLTPDIRMTLNQSSAWKNAKISIDGELKEQRHHGKDYIGLFVHGEHITLPHLREAEGLVRNKLREYSPTHNTDSLPVYLLSIVLVS
ncbi:MAG: hypothetical protein Q8K75_02860 [Chlamydiales bacterium]|nr:hypothetical protein [Chlamydiales bacterium]